MTVTFHDIPKLPIGMIRRDDKSNLIISTELKTTLRKDFGSVVFIDGRDHTNMIKMIDYSNQMVDDFHLISPGTDGCIIHNIKEQHISLAVPLADCGGIGFSNLSGSLIGIVHAGHLGTARDIISQIFEKIEEAETVDNMNFHLAPMVGKNYEFSSIDYHKNFSEILKRYGLEAKKYFTEINIEKGYLNLKQIIIDMIMFYGVKRENIDDSKIETNNLKNGYASHRMYTITGDDKFAGRNIFIVSK